MKREFSLLFEKREERDGCEVTGYGLEPYLGNDGK
jgi:hypothetical protein